jgi:hypothetical protein
MIVLAWIIVITLLLLALAVAALAVSNARTARQVEKALPPLGRFIDIDGSRIHYLDRGSGPTHPLHSRAGRPDASLHLCAARQARATIGS